MFIFRCDCVLTWMPLKKQDKPACEREDWDVDVCVCVCKDVPSIHCCSHLRWG